MLDNYINELRVLLVDNNIDNVDEVLEEIRDKYNLIIKAGKSSFEAVLALGDPHEIVARLSGGEYSAQDKLLSNMLDEPTNQSKIATKSGNTTIDDQLVADEELTQPTAKPNKSNEKTPTMAGLIATDIFYMSPAIIISTLGLIALVFLGGLFGVAGITYSVLCWTKFDIMVIKIMAFCMSIIGIVLCVGAFVLTAACINKMISGIKFYSADRQAKVDSIRANKV